MSALEQYSIAPRPARHLARDGHHAESRAHSDAEPYSLQVRLAERLFPGIIVLEEPGAARPQVWPRGVEGRRVPIERLAQLLLEHSPDEEERWLDSVQKLTASSLLPAVREAGPLAFACLPLPGASGGRFAALREEGPWDEEERALMRDLALVFSREVDRLHCQLQTAGSAPTQDAAEATPSRGGDRLASIAPLLRSLCHELNNPLTSIKSFAELLLLDPRSDEDREALEIVQREAHRAARIVGDLRMVARQSSEAAMAKELVNLNEVVRQVLDGRRQELRVERIALREELARQLPPVHAVRSHLEHVASHLLTHAVKSLEGWEGRREIILTTSASATAVRFSVRDSGRGIVPEHFGSVGDFDVPQAAGDTFNLSLGLIESIVAHHGGRMEASGRVGLGSIVTIELPIQEEDVAGVLAADEPVASHGLRVLVVDDEAPIRFSLARYLERRGHRVDQATDGAAALRLMNGCAFEDSYDIVIADLRMPGFDGEQLIRCLRDRGGRLEERIILMTGEPHGSRVPEEIERAGIPVLLKPFELAEVAQVIEAQARLAQE